jgi:hypothetical protein
LVQDIDMQEVVHHCFLILVQVYHLFWQRWLAIFHFSSKHQSNVRALNIGLELNRTTFDTPWNWSNCLVVFFQVLICLANDLIKLSGLGKRIYDSSTINNIIGHCFWRTSSLLSIFSSNIGQVIEIDGKGLGLADQLTFLNAHWLKCEHEITWP